jgi:hypothetical protein
MNRSIDATLTVGEKPEREGESAEIHETLIVGEFREIAFQR